MWGKQNDGEMIQHPPAQHPPAHRQPAQPSQPAAAAPAPGATRLGSAVTIIGDVTSEEELYFDGDLEGKLELRSRLTIGPNSKVKANIKAQEVIVFGSIKGNVESESRVSLRTGATIVGDIKTAGIVIEDGAYFKGGIDISRGEGANPKSAPKSQGTAAGQKR